MNAHITKTWKAQISNLMTNFEFIETQEQSKCKPSKMKEIMQSEQKQIENKKKYKELKK